MSPIISATSLARGSCEQRSLKESSITASCRTRTGAMISSKVGQIRGKFSPENPLKKWFSEETLWDSVNAISNGGVVQRCVGIVADGYNAKALRNLESENHWMAKLSCQFQGFNSLIKDFGKQLPLFRKVAENCLKIANFFNSRAQLRAGFEKLQLQELDQVGCALGMVKKEELELVKKGWIVLISRLELQ
ncbi:hypothetical protein AMTR_s00094p00127400 [Amborella trichopoda]|uniref:Uncharacterized protein n=1 Tax=Amborella trichopoda TaxID=13333 RepID=W1NUH4_AMBTC|nr:hypothetical protein AMTR_s00094p00127400 [Amborella trichopoda]